MGYGCLSFSCPRLCLRVWYRELGSAVPSRVRPFFPTFRYIFHYNCNIYPKFIRLRNIGLPSLGRGWLCFLTSHPRAPLLSVPKGLPLIVPNCRSLQNKFEQLHGGIHFKMYGLGNTTFIIFISKTTLS